MKCIDKNQSEWFDKESWGLMEFIEIDAPNSFAAKDYFSSEDGTIQEEMPGQRIEVELVEINGKTNVVSRSFTDSAEQLEQLVNMGMAEGFKSQLNRLEELLKA